ncbi:MAG: hypothetical protein QGF25_06255 [Candidatus Woesearchaeota archaeon]|jgi:hypothetical protein|nr:hypothetical protein [Candidatus Woesearchaeota archaeon]MDP7467812.1 hypothetical protein [Candidatus Woesearchaeota archaeon]MDP7647802.1 hypothetical protein [Candidatus Woesearchaeota archaeon]
MKSHLTKIVSAILIAISVLLWTKNTLLFTLLALGSIWTLFASQTRAKKLLDGIVKWEGKKILLTGFFDMINVALLVLVSKAIVFIYDTIIRKPLFGKLDLTTAGLANADLASAQLQLSTNFIVYSFLTLIIAWASLLIVYTATRRYTWQVLTKQQPFKQSIKFMLAWFAIFIPIFLLAAFQKAPANQFGVIFVGALFAHLVTIGMASFFTHGGVGRAIRHAFSQGIVGIANFITPYTYLLAAYYIIGNLWGILGSQLNLGSAANIVFMVLFLAWARVYVVRFLLDEKRI